jgi:hypothetical protein
MNKGKGGQSQAQTAVGPIAVSKESQIFRKGNSEC